MHRKPIFAALAAAVFAAAFAAAPNGMPTRLDVTSQPDGAQVFVDGALRGVTPCSVFDLAAGVHLLRLEAPGRVPLDEFIDIDDGAFVQKTYALETEKGLVLVKTDPPGAEVRHAGVSLGVTPLLITSFASGETYPLDLALNGYQTRRIDVRPDGRTPLVREETLALDSGTVECTSDPAGATVTVNGVTRGVTPVTLTHIPKGLATVTFSLWGYKEETRELRLTPGDRQTLAVKLAGKPARLTVVSTPENARVFLDGDYQGKTPATIAAVPAGRHEIRVELPGHAPLLRTVTLANGAEDTETFAMENVMGRLEIVTTPPGARVLLDGKGVGTTRSAGGDAVRSQVLALENIPAGDHSLLVRLDGHQDASRRVVVKSQDTGKLYIRLKRVFSADTEIETIRGTYRGVLVNKDYLGNITLEVQRGVEQTFHADEIRAVRPLAQD